MTDEPETDPLTLLDNIAPLLESVRGMVATFVNDGFTDDQAREIVAAMFRTYGRETE